MAWCAVTKKREVEKPDSNPTPQFGFALTERTWAITHLRDNTQQRSNTTIALIQTPGGELTRWLQNHPTQTSTDVTPTHTIQTYRTSMTKIHSSYFTKTLDSTSLLFYSKCFVCSIGPQFRLNLTRYRS